MVQAVQHGRGDDGTRGERIVLLIPVRYLLLDTLMGASLVVIRNVLPHQAMQLEAMEDEHIVQAFPFQTTHEAFTDGIGPWKSFGGS